MPRVYSSRLFLHFVRCILSASRTISCGNLSQYSSSVLTMDGATAPRLRVNRTVSNPKPFGCYLSFVIPSKLAEDLLVRMVPLRSSSAHMYSLYSTSLLYSLYSNSGVGVETRHKVPVRNSAWMGSITPIPIDEQISVHEFGLKQPDKFHSSRSMRLASQQVDFHGIYLLTDVFSPVETPSLPSFLGVESGPR